MICAVLYFSNLRVWKHKVNLHGRLLIFDIGVVSASLSAKRVDCHVANGRLPTEGSASKRRRSTTPTITSTPFKVTVSDIVVVLTSLSTKRVRYDVAHGTLPTEGSPLKRRRSTTPRVTNRRTPKFVSPNAGRDTSDHTGVSDTVVVPASLSTKRVHYDVSHGTFPTKGSPSKRRRSTTPRVTNRRTPKFVSPNAGRDASHHTGGVRYVYNDLGDCDHRCYHCGAAFWFGECLKGHLNSRRPEYHLCCGGGRIYMEPSPDLPDYIKHLLQNSHFLENIRAYNQMFAMTSFGAKIDESINNGRGPYVFKVSGQVYHWIGSLCPLLGEQPRFLQLYIYDTEHELENKMRHFGGLDARDRCQQIDVPEFKIRLYNADGARGYELPSSNTLGAIVFDSRLTGSTEFDVVIEHKGGLPKRINKLHKSYMSLQFLLLFIYGQLGFHTDLKLRSGEGTKKERRVTMLAYYSYQLHPRVSDYNLIFRGLHDTISRGEHDGYEVGGKIILLMSFTSGPRYMYAHYLDALAIYRKLGNLQFFITFTCKVKWPEITRYMDDYPELTASDRPDIADPEGYKIVSEMMIHGPCVSVNMSATCMQGDKCTKNFPKKFTPRTFFDDKGHVHYQRRDTGAHINVEYCGWIMLIKYLFKYISKGTDKIFARVSRPLGESSDAACLLRPPIDEIQNYLEGRFVCPYVALWRIYKFDIHCREPAVRILSVHLEDMQRVSFRDRDKLKSVVNLLEFVWYADRKSWSPRQNSRSSIGRLAYVHPTSESHVRHWVWLEMKKSRISQWKRHLTGQKHDIPGRVLEMTHIPNYHLNDDNL
ncbi:DNA helicase [Tanacetum coccineum]